MPLTIIVAELIDDEPSTIEQVMLFLLTFAFYIFVLYIAITQTVMVKSADVRDRYYAPTLVIVWMIALSSALSLTAKNLSWMSPKHGKQLEKCRQASTAFFEVSTYIAILFVVFHLYRINDKTM